MAEQTPVNITICMGSSCFSRGNNRTIEVIQHFLTNRDIAAPVHLCGHLCEGLCKQGPNVVIDGKLYQEVDPVTVLGLLNHHVPRKQAEL